MKLDNLQFEEKSFFVTVFNSDVYLVGGTIRDFLLYGEIARDKDIDLMVTGHDYRRIESRLRPHGKTNTVGKSFAVVKFTRHNRTYDISIPRQDHRKSQTSAAHRNFVIDSGPHISLEEDLRRRDFTCNSMALNLKTGTLIDPYGGLDAVRNRILAMTNPETFSDDPLRALRAARFAAVHELRIHPDIYQQVIPVEFGELSRERILEELIMLLLNVRRPSRGLEEYFNLTILEKLFPRLYALTLTLQDSRFHPETDRFGHHSVWGHTLLTVDIAADLARHFQLAVPRKLTLLLAALCHDIGKPLTTRWQYKRNRMTITSAKHDSRGSRMTNVFLKNLKIETRNGYPLRETVVNLVKNHHRLFDLYTHRDDISFKTISRMVRDLKGEDFLLVLLDYADRASRLPGGEKTENLDEISRWYLGKKEEWNISQDTIQPLIMGRDLKKLGVKSGPRMGAYLKKLYEYQLDGRFSTREEGIRIFEEELLGDASPGN
jgi:tRNA nucleotidyltransferase (CCA-adding enzyme)